ncbi:glycoside hydrolase family 78 protein [Aureobasidium pullulans]|nr:glycoside hydrolase family 78 protein [Aureobasidium pullulans]
MSAAQNTYRVQHYNISASNSTHTRRLLQGGVRWQILTLSSPGELILSEVGIIPSYYTPRPRASFDCSNRNWTNIWRAGAQTVALSMIAAQSIPDFWQISSEGAFIESAAPQPYAGLQAQALTSYRMNFMVKPITGGFSFKVLSDTLGDGIYVWINLSNSTISAYSGSTEVDTLLQTARLNVTSSLLSAYFVSEAQTQGVAQDANAMAILANVPQGNHTALGISQAMSRLLFVDHGALPFSNTTTGFSKLISPYASSYHLRAAFAAHDAQAASHLLNNLWLPMILKTNANYTGCFWETLDLDGRPGLGDGTSLCHAWSSGPTAELSRNVLGIQPVAPGFREWRVAPQSLGLTWAKGSQPTPFGDIAVDWRIDEAGLVTITVESPVGTHGTVSMPESIAATNGSRAVVTIVNGRLIKGPTFAVQGGEPFELSQYLR